MKKVLVAGGAGFIGSHVVNELRKRKIEVRVLDNFVGGNQNLGYFDDGVEVIEGDTCRKEDCKKALEGCDTVFNLAAHAAEGQSVFIPVFNAQTNLIGSVTLLAETINAGIRDVVFTSSIATYGKQKKMPIKETAPLNVEDPYAITKKAFEDYLRVYHELGQIDPYIVRFFNVYGPRQRMDDPYRGVVPIFINKCLKKENPVIFGDGLQKRAFTYISDVVEPICGIVGNKKLVNNPINIGTEKVYTVKKLAEEIIKKMDPEMKIEFIPKRTSDVKIAYCDTGKAKKLLKYRAKVSLSDGLDKTIEWAKGLGAQEFRYFDYTEIPKLTHGAYTSKKI
ncbi:MAG: NAD-dependent epimerase/dehydratase family protein [Candidatus ainarchaeum sp.]|nr:NAD-dependent epimerase/dehydratase family protein [Candidatus ainarchaeum sp.]